VNPFLILLMGLGATVGADAHGEWRKRQRMDDLRRKLGLWEQSPTYFKGSIANRLNWIESQFGLRAAIWAREAAVLSVAPLGFFKSHDDTGIAPFLPWLAWRLVNGDKPELVAVLEAEHHQVEKDVEYTKDHAWSDIRRLLDWYEGARPDLFDYTWNQAIAAEQKWFPTSIKIWKGELVYRFALREDDIDEDDKQGTGEWIVTEMLDLDARIAAVSHFTRESPRRRSLPRSATIGCSKFSEKTSPNGPTRAGTMKRPSPSSLSSCGTSGQIQVAGSTQSGPSSMPMTKSGSR